MTKLLVINQFASIPENLYGAGERMFHMSPFLNKAGYKVTIISGGYNHLFKKCPEITGLFNIQKFDSFDFIWVRLRKYNSNNFIGRVFSWFEFLFKLFLYKPAERPDIVIVSSMSLLPIVYAVWMKFKYKCKFILEIRDIWPLTPMEIGGYSSKNPLMFFLRKLELFGYKKADFIVSVLPGFKKYLSENGFSKVNFRWIPNGVMPHLNKTITPSINFNKNKFNIVYAGAIGKANALDFLVDACRLIMLEYPHIHVNIIGDGPDKGALMNRSVGLTNVTFFNKVSKNEVAEILVNADVCYIGWHDRKLYNYGVSANKYNDYMLSRRPILSSSTIHDDPVLISRSGIKVDPDPRSIADGIIQFYKMTNKERELMGLSGFEFVTKFQTYPILANSYIDVLKAVALKKI